MKKNLLLLLALINVATVFAQLNGDGYYRIKNFQTERYIYIKDNRGSINIGASTADLGAIELWRGFDKAVSDAGTVIYIKKVGNDTYRFHCQGTNSYEIVGEDLKIRQNRDKSTYKAYQGKVGMIKYLADIERSASRNRGVMGVTDTDGDSPYRKWLIEPVSESSANYFGLSPELKVGDNFYTTFYTEFPFSFSSVGMQAFVVKKVVDDVAIIEELNVTEFSPETPIIVRSSSLNAADNKLSLGAYRNAESSPSILKGNYFCYPREGKHQNIVPYNPETMRMLALSSEGKLVFAKSDIEYLPSNRAYLPVVAGSPDVIRVMTQEEYEEVTGIVNVNSTMSTDKKVYSMTGVAVAESIDVLKTLPAGVYVVGGKKYVVK